MRIAAPPSARSSSMACWIAWWMQIVEPLLNVLLEVLERTLVADRDLVALAHALVRQRLDGARGHVIRAPDVQNPVVVQDRTLEVVRRALVGTRPDACQGRCPPIYVRSFRPLGSATDADASRRRRAPLGLPETPGTKVPSGRRVVMQAAYHISQPWPAGTPDSPGSDLPAHLL